MGSRELPGSAMRDQSRNRRHGTAVISGGSRPEKPGAFTSPVRRLLLASQVRFTIVCRWFYGDGRPPTMISACVSTGSMDSRHQRVHRARRLKTTR